jgi:hypothetical protein
MEIRVTIDAVQDNEGAVHKKLPSFITRHQKVFAYLLVCAALLAVCGVFFLPEVVSAYWHIVHGKSARFHEWEVPVPMGWWAFAGEGTLIVQKMNRSVGRDSAVVVGDLPESGFYDYEKRKGSLIEIISKDGYRLVEERKVRVAGGEGYCFSFSSIHNAGRIRIACDVPQRRLFLDFTGGPAHAAVFDSIIQHITPTGPRPKTSAPAQASQVTHRAFRNSRIAPHGFLSVEPLAAGRSGGW